MRVSNGLRNDEEEGAREEEEGERGRENADELSSSAIFYLHLLNDPHSLSVCSSLLVCTPARCKLPPPPPLTSICLFLHFLSLYLHNVGRVLFFSNFKETLFLK